MKYTGNMPGLLESIAFVFPEGTSTEEVLRLHKSCMAVVEVDDQGTKIQICQLLSKGRLKRRENQWRIRLRFDAVIPPECDVSAKLVNDGPEEDHAITVRIVMDILGTMAIAAPDFERHTRN